MNVWLLSAASVTGLLAVGHVIGGGKFVYRPMVEAEFDEVAQRTMVFVWHLSTLVLFMTAAGLAYAAYAGGSDTLVAYLLAQSLALALIHLATAVTSSIAGWAKKMPQWIVFLVIAGLTAKAL